MFREDVPLKELNNYRIGGLARYFFEAESLKELREALQEAKSRNFPIFVLAGGTNLLINDYGFSGLVLKPSVKFLENNGETVSVGCGISFSELLDFCATKGFSGLEWAGGLPGTVGGAIRGNAGAFGGEIKDVIKNVLSLDMESFDMIKREKDECLFYYRSSVFKKSSSEIIISAELVLKKGDQNLIKESTQKKIDYRREHHPLEHPNAGSIFKNVEVTKIPKKYLSTVASVIKTDPFPVVPAAFLISEAGLKGIGCGGAMISEKHPNFIVNFSSATSEDVICLIELVKKEIKKRFRVDLEEEIVRVE